MAFLQLEIFVIVSVFLSCRLISNVPIQKHITLIGMTKSQAWMYNTMTAPSKLSKPIYMNWIDHIYHIQFILMYLYWYYRKFSLGKINDVSLFFLWGYIKWIVHETRNNSFKFYSFGGQTQSFASDFIVLIKLTDRRKKEQ